MEFNLFVRSSIFYHYNGLLCRWSQFLSVHSIAFATIVRWQQQWKEIHTYETKITEKLNRLLIKQSNSDRRRFTHMHEISVGLFFFQFSAAFFFSAFGFILSNVTVLPLNRQLVFNLDQKQFTWFINLTL